MKKKFEIQKNDLYPESEWKSVKIGEGAYGEVWLCRNGDRQVAIKQFDKSEFESKDAFNAELKGFKKSGEHEHIVRFLQAYEIRHFYCIALEYCVQGSLEGLNEHQYTEADIRDIVMQCSDALEHMRLLSMVHRDIKPENIFVRSWKPLNVALGDFNYSRTVSGPYHTTVMSTNVGTPSYKAPELDEKLFRNEDNRYNFKVDVFALGMVAYELITLGEKPSYSLPEEKVKQLLQKHKNDEFRIKFNVDKVKAIKTLYGQMCKQGVELVNRNQWDMVSEQAQSIISKMVLPLYNKRCNYTTILHSPWSKLNFDQSTLRILN